jgi:hypothetical protein
MVKTIALVSCVSKKGTSAAPARSLYLSSWFRKASDVAILISDQWFILSAKYGLVEPNKLIEPYNLTLNQMSVTERQAWARNVLSILLRLLEAGDQVIFLAGKRYREFLIDPLLEYGCNVEIPMEGMRIGEQLQWLNQQLDTDTK